MVICHGGQSLDISAAAQGCLSSTPIGVFPPQNIPYPGTKYCFDENIFCLHVESNSMAPNFVKGDYLIISPETWTRSGDIAAVEYGNENLVKAIMQVNYMEEFVVLESVNHKSSPIALVRGKDHFRVIGKMIYRYQRML